LGKTGFNLTDLFGEWVHSREEDTADEAVFRPASYEFPPSRGRAAFKIGSDKSFVSSGIGPTDINTIRQGRWSLEDSDDPKLLIDLNNEKDVLSIKSLDKNRLVVKKGI
jgi:hypothetical protein